MGPFTHYAAVQQTKKLMNTMKIPFNVGTILDAIEPDILQLPGHGWDIDGTNNGGLINNMETYFENIKKKLARGADISRDVRILCHWCTDAHAIGHLSHRFWGNIDTRVETAGDLVTQKDKNPIAVRAYANKQAIRSAIFTSMKGVYNSYQKKCTSWTFLFSSDLKNMTRNGVQKGAEFTAAYVRLAKMK